MTRAKELQAQPRELKRIPIIMRKLSPKPCARPSGIDIDRAKTIIGVGHGVLIVPEPKRPQVDSSVQDILYAAVVILM
jgi:hypothetical protein